MNYNRRDLALPIIIDAILTGLFIYLLMDLVMKNSSRILATLAFFAINLVILYFLIDALRKLFRVLSLKGLKVNTYAYHLYPFALIVSFITVNLILFRMARYYAPAYVMAGAIGLSLVLLIICQLGGAFPDKRIADRKIALRHENAGGAAGGFEVLGSMTGKYDDGIVIGTNIFPYSTLSSMHRSADSVIIEGHGDRKSELIIVSDKSKPFFIELLAKRLNMPEKEVKTGYNVKRKDKKDEYYLHNRQQRRREMRNRKNKDENKA